MRRAQSSGQVGEQFHYRQVWAQPGNLYITQPHICQQHIDIYCNILTITRINGLPEMIQVMRRHCNPEFAGKSKIQMKTSLNTRYYSLSFHILHFITLKNCTQIQRQFHVSRILYNTSANCFYFIEYVLNRLTTCFVKLINKLEDQIYLTLMNMKVCKCMDNINK